METEKAISVLANWNPEKGTPFVEAVRVKEEFDFPEIVMMDWKEDADLEALLLETITEVKFSLHVKTVFETIQHPYQCKILSPLEENAFEKEKYVDGIEMVQDGNVIYPKKISDVSPIKVYLDYPFDKVAEVTINPFGRNGDKQMNFGYIIWQVCRAYAEIYKNRWQEFGVWGHSFDDLYIEEMQIRKNNTMTFFIGS